MITLKAGDKVWSGFFDSWITIVEIAEDSSWWFRDPKDRHITKAKTPLSWFIERDLYRKS